jgi:hypothetical protein
MTIRISQLDAAGSLTGAELLELSKPSATVSITAATISALASDNSYNDSGSGFVTAGFAVGMAVRVSGFTGNVANNIFTGVITALTTGKMTIGGTDGDVIVDDAAGESVTITAWQSARSTPQDVANLATASHPVNAQTGTSYAVLSTDRKKRVTLTNASSIAATIAQAGGTGFEDGYFAILENIGVGAVTLTPATSTINGATTLVLTSGMSATVYSDGTNYRAIVNERPGVPVKAETGTTYTYLSGDRHSLVTHTNASAIAGTLPQAIGAFGAGWHAWVENRGAGTLTITPTTSTIDGAASLALTTNQGVFIVSDGTNYYTVRGIGGGGGSGASKFVAWLSPSDSQPPLANFATHDTRNNILVLEYDASTDESAFWTRVIPTQANLASGLLFRNVWMADTATSGTTRWGNDVWRANSDMDTDSYDTAATAGGTANGTSGIPTTTDIINTNLDGLAAGELAVFRSYRDADGTSGTDDMTGDAQQIGILVETVA